MRRSICIRLSAVLLAGFLALLLPIGKNAGAASGLSLKKTAKTLYLGGCRGRKADGTAAKYYSRAKAAGFLKGFDPEKMDLLLKTEDKSIASVSSKKDRIYAKGIGNTTVTLEVVSKKTGKKLYTGEISVSVKRNADGDSLRVLGIEDGDLFEAGESIDVLLPDRTENETADTDLRTLICTQEGVTIEKGSLENSFVVYFDEPGEYTITAAAYQSAKYTGYTAEKEIDITVIDTETELWQTGINSFCIEGNLVYDDMLPSDIEVREAFSDIDLFYTGVDSVEVKDGTAYVTVFREFESGQRYIIRFEGEEFEFTAPDYGIENVTRMELDCDSLTAGVVTGMNVRCYNSAGIDLTEKLRDILDERLRYVLLGAGPTTFINGNCIYVSNPGESISVRAVLESELLPGGSISAEKKFISKREGVPEYTGVSLYTFAKEDDAYMLPSDVEKHYIPYGSETVFEALLLFDDGKYRTLKDAGITELRIDDETVIMQKSALFAAMGGTRISVNNKGATYIRAYRGNVELAAFRVDVTEESRPDRLEVSLSKDKLNTDFMADDYLIIKADVFDGYGEVLAADGFTITQTDENAKLAGRVDFGEFSSGRLIVYGTDCNMTGKSSKIEATVSCAGFSKEISFDAGSVEYDPDRMSEYDFVLKTDGKHLLDTGLSIEETETDSVFLCVEVSKDGYLIGEFGAEILDEPATMNKSADDYGVAAGEGFFAVQINYTPEGKKEPVTVVENDCIEAAYDGIEIFARVPGSTLENGTYEIILYYITGGEEISQIDYRGGNVVIRAFDQSPEIVYDQIAESAAVDKIAPWTKNIKNFFKFYLEGEDITDYVTKVTFNESGTGSYYIREAVFRLKCPGYGYFEKSCPVGVLVKGKY